MEFAFECLKADVIIIFNFPKNTPLQRHLIINSSTMSHLFSDELKDDLIDYCRQCRLVSNVGRANKGNLQFTVFEKMSHKLLIPVVCNSNFSSETDHNFR